MRLTKQFNKDVEVGKKINVQKWEHNSFKKLNRNKISFIICSITFCKEIIFM